MVERRWVKHHHGPSRRSFEGAWSERWSNGEAALVGYLTARGASAPDIARRIGRGVIPATIRAMWLRWELKHYGLETTGGGGRVPVVLEGEEIAALEQRAAAAGCTPAEWLTRMLSCAISDDMFRAIVG